MKRKHQKLKAERGPKRRARVATRPPALAAGEPVNRFVDLLRSSPLVGVALDVIRDASSNREAPSLVPRVGRSAPKSAEKSAG